MDKERGLLLLRSSKGTPKPTSGEVNSTPLQYSCLENPMDRGVWWATVHGVAKSQTWLSNFSFTFHFHALEKAMAPHSSTLAWKTPWVEKPGGLPVYGVAQSQTWLKRRSSKPTSGYVLTWQGWLADGKSEQNSIAIMTYKKTLTGALSPTKLLSCPVSLGALLNFSNSHSL